MAKLYGMTGAGTDAEVRLWSLLIASVAVTIAVSSLTGDSLLRRSFRDAPLTAAAQVRRRVDSLSVPGDDPHDGPVLARIWHAELGYLMCGNSSQPPREVAGRHSLGGAVCWCQTKAS